jgi:hypothetical protein
MQVILAGIILPTGFKGCRATDDDDDDDDDDDVTFITSM